MDESIYMPLTGALNLINLGHRIAHIRYWTKAYFLVKTPYDMELNEACKACPSWLWMPDERAFKVHYLDLPTLEAIIFRNNYTVKYDTDAVKDLRALKAMYLERREWKKNALVEIPTLRPMEPKQIIGSQFMYKSRYALNGDAPGCCKTAQTIGAMILNKMEGLPSKTLILCPASVKGVWLKEIKTMTNEFNALILQSNMEKRYEQYENLGSHDVLIISYDSFIRDYDIIPEHFMPNILVLDEIHRAANKKNKITQSLIGGKDIKKTFLRMVEPRCIYQVTGSPLGNKMEDLYALLKIMDQGLFSWTGFCNRYTVQEEAQRWVHKGGVSRPMTYRKVVGYQNENELKAKLSLHMVRRCKKDMVEGLPKKSLQIREIELGAEERKIYNNLRDDYHADIRGKEITIVERLAWITRAQQIADSLELVPGSPTKKSSKLEELIEIVETRAGQEKIVIFTKFAKMAHILERELKHLHPILLDGATPTDDRTELIAAFQDNPKHRVFIGTYGAGGVGVTLTAASCLILYDAHWNPAVDEQAIGRVDRKGQLLPVTIILMKALDTIDEHVMEVVTLKQDMIDSTVGDEETTLAGMSRELLESII